MAAGIVIKTQNSFYYVADRSVDGQTVDEKKLITCKLRGRFKKEKIAVTTGDHVEYDVLPDGTGIIEQRHPRLNILKRPPVANIDQIIVVFATVHPEPHPLLIDRFLTLAEWSDIPEIVLCFNKIDQEHDLSVEEYVARYRSIGYRVLTASAANGDGIAEIRSLFRGRTTVLAGPSGVGKSSLCNAVCSELNLNIGGLSDKIKRGKHTTRLAQLFSVADGWLVDTPGFSSVSLAEIEAPELANFFPEFRSYIGQCYFRGCLHDHEPRCRVKDAVEQNAIDKKRYASYINILQEIKERKKEWE